MIDAKAFGAELADIVKAATAPILSRIEALERRIDAMPLPRDGKDAVADEIAATVRSQIKADLDAIRAAIPELPELPELPDIPAMIAGAVDEAVKTLPVAKDGEPGTSVTLDDVLPALHAQVKAHLDAIPAPQDGNDGRDGVDGAPGRDGKDGVAGAPGRDGLDVKDLFRADGGRLVAVMSDGTTKDLGQFVGSDGAPGHDGKDGDDGLGFEDMDFEVKDGRLYAMFRRGDVIKEARIPSISYRGVWKSGEYLAGDSVTFGACQWIAIEDTDDKPGDGKAWQLAVRKGRDGKDGVIKTEASKAREGRDVG